MNAEFFDALDDIEREKGIPKSYMLDKITLALLAAYKKDNPNCGENVIVNMDDDKKKVDMYLLMEVVEEVEDPATQILPEAALSYSKHPKVGGFVEIPIETKKFGRIAAQAAKQVIIQGIREAERGRRSSPARSRALTRAAARSPSRSPQTPNTPRRCSLRTSRSRARSWSKAT